MNQLNFANLLERFLDETLSAEELDVFLIRVKERRDDIFIQNVILDKLESGAYSGLSEQGRLRDFYQQTLLRVKERQAMEKAGQAIERGGQVIGGAGQAIERDEQVIRGAGQGIERDEQVMGAGQAIEGDEHVIGAGQATEGDEHVIGAGQGIERDEHVIGAGQAIAGDEHVIGAGQGIERDEHVIGAGQGIERDEHVIGAGQVIERDEHVMGAGQTIEKSEQAIIRSGQAITRSEQAVTRSEQAVTRSEQAVTRSEQAVTRSEQAVTRSEQMQIVEGDRQVRRGEEGAIKWLPGERGLRLGGWWMRAGVAAFVMLLLGAGVYLLVNRGQQMKKNFVVRESDPGKEVGYARFIVLPDGSSVVLNAGSTLEFPEVFRDKREVKLKGEAYFDIKKNADRPFIIYTGDVKTTVLGTTFNIQAYPLTNKVVVSVTSGKVKVESKKKLLAVLNKNQQVLYDVPAGVVRQETVNAEEVVTDWAKKDMVFDEESFESVVQMIERRYGVGIEFRNPVLKDCIIKASFSGTEPLENVLEVLSTISNSSYIKENGKFYILGEGCNGK